MNYSLVILRRAQKELASLPGGDFEPIREAIQSLVSEPRPHGVLKLKGREGWRIRVGKYRAIFEIDDRRRSITVLHVGRRGDVYR